MKSWNYRVVLTVEEGEESFGIHEAYYDDHQPPHAITHDAVRASADSIEGLRGILHLMLAALDQPVLDYDDF